MKTLPTIADLEKFDFTDPLCLRALMEFVRKSVDKAPALNEVIKFPAEGEENLYGAAEGLYRDKQYDAAYKIFEKLVWLDLKKYKYALGAAASLHAMKLYPMAVVYYTLATMNEPENPVPYYFAGECSLSYESRAAALVFYKKAVDLAKGKEGCESIYQKSVLMVQSLEAFSNEPSAQIDP